MEEIVHDASARPCVAGTSLDSLPSELVTFMAGRFLGLKDCVSLAAVNHPLETIIREGVLPRKYVESLKASCSCFKAGLAAWEAYRAKRCHPSLGAALPSYPFSQIIGSLQRILKTMTLLPPTQVLPPEDIVAHVHHLCMFRALEEYVQKNGLLTYTQNAYLQADPTITPAMETLKAFLHSPELKQRLNQQDNLAGNHEVVKGRFGSLQEWYPLPNFESEATKRLSSSIEKEREGSSNKTTPS